MSNLFLISISEVVFCNVKMVEVLEYSSKLMRVFALLPDPKVKDQIWHILLNLMWFALISCLFLPTVRSKYSITSHQLNNSISLLLNQIAFLWLHLDDVAEATEAMYFFGGNIMLIVKYIAFFVNRHSVISVKHGLQENINRSNVHSVHNSVI